MARCSQRVKRVFVSSISLSLSLSIHSFALGYQLFSSDRDFRWYEIDRFFMSVSHEFKRKKITQSRAAHVFPHSNYKYANGAALANSIPNWNGIAEIFIISIQTVKLVIECELMKKPRFSRKAKQLCECDVIVRNSIHHMVMPCVRISCIRWSRAPRSGRAALACVRSLWDSD